MPAAKPISATQAAEAICLLISDHTTASGYLHELNGEQTGMSRTEFKAYLRTSSQEEYFELLDGHVPIECATLVTKAAETQEKRKAKSQPLAGQAPAKDTAKRLFEILDLKASSGLHFKDVRKAMKALPLPSAKPAKSKPTGPITPPNPGQRVKEKATKQAPAPAQPNFKPLDVVKSVERPAQVEKPAKVEKPVKGEKPVKHTTVAEKKVEELTESPKAAKKEKSKAKTESEQKDEPEHISKRKEARKARLVRKEAKKARKARRAERIRQEEQEKSNAASAKKQPKPAAVEDIAPTPAKDIVDPAAGKQATVDTTQAPSSDAADRPPSSTTAKDVPSTTGKKSKKRKHDATSAPEPTPSKPIAEVVTQAIGESQMTKSQRKREAKRLKKADAEVPAPLPEKSDAQATKETAIVKQEAAAKGSERDSKKQKVSHEPPATSPAVVSTNKAKEVTMTDAPATDVSAVAPASIDPEQGSTKKTKERRMRRKSTAMEAEENAAKKSTAPVAATEDVEMASPELEVQQLPAPTQETAEFVSATEPENPFSDQPSNDDSTATDMFRLGRTLLPVVEPKSWSPESSPTHRSPALSDFELSSASDLEDERSVAAGKPEGDLTAPNSDVSYESLESWAKSSLHEEEDPNNDVTMTEELAQASQQPEQEDDMVEAEETSATPDELASAQLMSEINASQHAADAPQASTPALKSSSPKKKDFRSGSVSTHRSNQSPVRRTKGLSGIQRLKREASPATSIASSGWGTSLRGGLQWSGRTSIGFAPMPPVLPRVGMVLPKANSIPTNAGEFDVKEAFRNFNKFLNDGHSSEQSDESSSSSDSDDEPPPKIKTVTKPIDKTPVEKPAVTGAVSKPEEPVVALSTIKRAYDNKSPPGVMAAAKLTQPSSPANELPVLPQATAELAESADADTSISKDQVMEDYQPNEERATKMGVPSFSSFNERISPDTRYEASPSPELDLPALMDEGGYVPRLSESANHTSDNRSANDNSGVMNVDLLSPFKNENRAESPAEEGTVRPSEMIEYTSSPPPLRRSPAKDMEMEADGVQYNLNQQSAVEEEYEGDGVRLGSSSPMPYPAGSDQENEEILVEGEDGLAVGDEDGSSVDGEDKILVEGEEAESDNEQDESGDKEGDSSSNESGEEAVGYDEVVLEESAQATEEPSIMDGLMAELSRDAASPKSLPGAKLDMHIVDDQAMANSQIPAQASVQPSEDAPRSQPVAVRSSPMVVIHRSPKSELAKFQYYSEAESSDEARQEDENVKDDRKDDGKERDEEGEDSRAKHEESKNNLAAPLSLTEPDHCFDSDSTSALIADGCLVYSGASDIQENQDSSMEWEADDNLSEWEAAKPSTTEDKERPKRKSTGTTSNHFSATPEKKKAKSTGTISKHFSASPEKKRRVAGESCVPFPKLNAPIFGLIQEKLWKKPFHLLCAVLFLNKTSGKSARDVIMKVLDRWPNPWAMARADLEELLSMIETLGLQNERAKKLIRLGETFENDEPQPGKRHRTLHYPNIDDGKTTRDGEKTTPKQILKEDFDEIEGFLEIGHVYGAGPYAYDSWRIFCRDVMRSVAQGYNGEGAGDDFEPEWKRVVPKDKELRACLRWMWLREGWDWDPLTGEKQPATMERMNEANEGIAEWIEPVPINPHGVDMGEDGDGPDALVPGVDEEVRETVEEPHQGVQDGLVEEAPTVARVTRRSTRQASAAVPALSQQTTKIAKPQRSPAKATKPTTRKTSQEMKPTSEEATKSTKLKSQQVKEDPAITHPHLYGTSAQRLKARADAGMARIAAEKAALNNNKRKRSTEDDAELPPTKALKTTSANPSGVQSTPVKAPSNTPVNPGTNDKRPSPRSIRRVKREMLEDYERSLIEDAAAAQNPPPPATAPTPTTITKPSLTFAASQPERPIPSPMDSPAKNTRQRVSAKAKATVAAPPAPIISSSPPELARASPSPSSQLLSSQQTPLPATTTAAATAKRTSASATHKSKARDVLYKGEPTDILYKSKKVRDVVTTPATRSVATRATPAPSSTQPVAGSSSRASGGGAAYRPSASQPTPVSSGKLRRIPKLRERMLPFSNEAKR